jgi:hypothetical protein
VFDERLPACEDYDLWLRITWKYPVHLIPVPLIVKRGGHPDQLSRMPELDKYRIQSIAKILRQGCLSPSQRAAALTILEHNAMCMPTDASNAADRRKPIFILRCGIDSTADLSRQLPADIPTP